MGDSLRFIQFTTGVLTLKQTYNISVEVKDEKAGDAISFGMSELCKLCMKIPSLPHHSRIPTTSECDLYTEDYKDI